MDYTIDEELFNIGYLENNRNKNFDNSQLGKQKLLYID